MDKKGAVKRFIAGMIMTMSLAVLVPILSRKFILPSIEGFIGDSSFLMLSSDALVTLFAYLIIAGFMSLLGGTVILRQFGFFGILGLLAAYFVLGDIHQALIPILMMTLSWIIMEDIKITRDRWSKGARADDSRREASNRKKEKRRIFKNGKA